MSRHALYEPKAEALMQLLSYEEMLAVQEKQAKLFASRSAKKAVRHSAAAASKIMLDEEEEKNQQPPRLINRSQSSSAGLFTELAFSWQSKKEYNKSTSTGSGLRAVIPTADDLVPASLAFAALITPASWSKATGDDEGDEADEKQQPTKTKKRPASAPKHRQSEGLHDHGTPKPIRERKKEEQRLQKEWEERVIRVVPRRNGQGIPIYTLKSHHKLEWEEQQKKQAELNMKEDARRKAILDRNFVVQNHKSGIKYVYDWRGFKVPEGSQLQKPKVEQVVEKNQGPYFKGLIIKKSEKFVESMKSMVKQESEARRNKWGRLVKWQPCGLPSSTFALNRKDKVLPLESLRMWPEYNHMKPNDVIVTIEHCCGCELHEWETRHDEKVYLKVARAVRDALAEVAAAFAVRFACLLKPINKSQAATTERFPTLGEENFGTLVNSHTATLPSKDASSKEKLVVQKVLTACHSNRVGSLEVQMSVYTKSGERATHILHSKLFRGTWPHKKSIKAVCKKILQSMHVSELPEPLSVVSYIENIACGEHVGAPLAAEGDACNFIFDSSAYATAYEQPEVWYSKVGGRIDRPAIEDALGYIVEMQSKEEDAVIGDMYIGKVVAVDIVNQVVTIKYLSEAEREGGSEDEEQEGDREDFAYSSKEIGWMEAPPPKEEGGEEEEKKNDRDDEEEKEKLSSPRLVISTSVEATDPLHEQMEQEPPQDIVVEADGVAQEVREQKAEKLGASTEEASSSAGTGALEAEEATASSSPRQLAIAATQAASGEGKDVEITGKTCVAEEKEEAERDAEGEGRCGGDEDNQFESDWELEEAP